jgi:hypothetical protein
MRSMQIVDRNRPLKARDGGGSEFPPKQPLIECGQELV